MPFWFLFIVYWMFLAALVFGATFGARSLLRRFELPLYLCVFAAPTLYLVYILGFLLLDTDRFSLVRIGFFQKQVLSNLVWLFLAGVISTFVLRYFRK